MKKNKRGRDGAEEAQPAAGAGTFAPPAAQQPNKRAQQQPGGKKQQAGCKQQQQESAQQTAAGQQHYVSNIQVLTTDVGHNAASLLLFVDKEGRLLFNVGEGLQRMFRENKLRIVKLDQYFFTRISTETMSGLPGMLLSSSSGATGNNDAGGLLDAPQATCHLYGPKGLQAYLKAFEAYVHQEHTLSVHEIDDGPGLLPPVVKTKYMTVTPLLVRLNPGTSGETVEEQAGKRARAETPPLQDTQVILSDKVSEELNYFGDAHNGSYSGDVLCYAVELAGVPGKFNVQIAEKLGVPNGPLRGQLQKGTAVTLPDGRVVEPSQVVSASVPGPLLLVVDMPSSAHLAALQSQATLKPWLPPSAAPCMPALGAVLSGEAAQTAAAAMASRGGQGPADHPKRVCVMAHLGPAELVSSPEYVAWLASMGPGVQHVLCSSGGQACTLRRATELQAKLHCISPVLFPLLHTPSPLTQQLPIRVIQTAETSQTVPTSGAPDASLSQSGISTLSTGASAVQWVAVPGLGEQQVLRSWPLIKYHLMPVLRQGVDVGEVGEEPDPTAVGLEYPVQAPEVVALAQTLMGEAGGHVMHVMPPPVEGMGADQQGLALQAAEDSHPSLAGIQRGACTITFLGTAGSQPSKYRNVSAMHVGLGEGCGVLLDCGEDTLGQLKRRFGAAGAEKRVRELRLVWVSHMHADHHGGLYRLLQLRAQLAGPGAPPLLVVGPGPLMPVLTAYQQAVPLPFLFLPNEWLLGRMPGRGPPLAVRQAFTEAVEALGLVSLQPIAVVHIAYSCGIRLQGRSGWVVVYSGDSRPCDKVIKAARDASLLIHEATFEDDKSEDAERKRHSTTGDALQVAEQANVYRVVLTHFSTRYPTMPVVDVAAHPNMAVACDFMTVDLADLPWLPKVTAPLAALFKREARGWEQDEVAAVAAPIA